MVGTQVQCPLRVMAQAPRAGEDGRAESQVRMQQVPGKAANFYKYQLGASVQVRKCVLTVRTAATAPKVHAFHTVPEKCA